MTPEINCRFIVVRDFDHENPKSHVVDLYAIPYTVVASVTNPEEALAVADGFEDLHNEKVVAIR